MQILMQKNIIIAEIATTINISIQNNVIYSFIRIYHFKIHIYSTDSLNTKLYKTFVYFGDLCVPLIFCIKLFHDFILMHRFNHPS